ncbi:hypothetical protein ES703_110259 [subsurface metagenome]
MIRVYILPVRVSDGVESVLGTDIIHDALLLATPFPDLRKLIMDTSVEEHEQLELRSEESGTPTQADIDAYNAQVEILPPDPDTIRAEEILSNSPDVITQPELWELVRIFGRRLGYRG